MSLIIERPIVFFDLETTGINVKKDKIIEYSFIKLHPDSSRDDIYSLVNPQMPIPPESTEVHHITDEDVVDAPVFRNIAQKVYEYIKDCDLGGYNCLRFDIPLLTEEFKRVGIKYDTSNVKVLDAQVIFHKKEQRTLSAALKFYCGREHIDAHGAKSDVQATIDVLYGELEKYDDLPKKVNELSEICTYRDKTWIDKNGKLRWRNGEPCLSFGQNAGMSLKELYKKDPKYLRWMLKADFSDEVKEMVKSTISGNLPNKQIADALANFKVKE